MPPLQWTDVEEIALQLLARHAEMDPLTVRFTELRRWVCELPDFKDDPAKSNEKVLEAIQMAWYEEWQDAKG